jgi:lipid A 3-O-deacylase
MVCTTSETDPVMKGLIKKYSNNVDCAIDAAVKLGKGELVRFDGCQAIKVIIRTDWGRSKASMQFGEAGHESLIPISRFCLKVMGYSLFVALIVVLITAWLVSDPILRALDYCTHTAKQKAEKQYIKEHLLTKKNRCRNLMAIISASATLWSRTAEAQSPVATADSATDAIHTWSFSNTNIWQNGVGNGFKAGTQSISLSLGAGYGLLILGSRQSHDLALAGISYGYMLGKTEGEGHWYRGNWELRGELISGGQFSPTSDWLVGITPHVRYNFATGTRWLPYVDLGAGVSATSIGPPDLSHYFEFNLQAATGVRWFVRDNVALGIEARYLHMSCADIHTPNLGLNNVNGMLSISWFF